MKKSLLTVALLATVLSVSAQATNTPLMHIDQNGLFYVGKDALVYNGGGLQTKGTGTTGGIVENHGNVMISGVAGDVFRNLDGNDAVITTANAGGRFINKLNEFDSYNVQNPTVPFDPANSSTAPKFTYGQLSIDGLNQSDITGVVNQEYRQVKHGDYQQMGMPFYDKVLSSLNSEMGKTFSASRYSLNEILVWNNNTVVSANMPNGVNTKFGVDVSPYGYFMVGAAGMNVSANVKTLIGRPLATTGMSVNLTGAGANVNFGNGGFGINGLNEYYNSYLTDGFYLAQNASASAWTGNFGKNIYQFGNPFLTNLDLSQIAYGNDGGSATAGDGNNITNIYGVRLEPQGAVIYNPAYGSYVTAKSKQILFGLGVPTGDVDYMMIRPFGTFVVKLTDNSNQTLNLSTLRRFNYYPRAQATPYSVTASKTGSNSTVKQLGVIGLDVNGNELERTYYVVAANAVSGHTSLVKSEVTTNGNLLGTFSENPMNGGYDNANLSYFLYVNEANEVDFKGKNIKMVNYNPNIVSFKFEIRENASLVPDGTHTLSSGEGFYYKLGSATSVSSAIQGAVVSASGTSSGVSYDLYYGLPSNLGGGGNGSLGTSDVNNKELRTLVVYNPDNDGYFVRFDPKWKKANIDVFDMSGKIVLSKKDVDASKDYDLDLDKGLKTSYIVSIISDTGIKVTSKIVK